METSRVLHWRPLKASELDHERLWLGVGAAGSVSAVAAWQAGVRPPGCLFHLATGYPCPGCGSTRAILQLAQGHLAAAWTFNPLITVGAFAAVAWSLYAMAALLRGRSRLRVGKLPRRWSVGLRVATVAAVVANWCWVLAHGW